MYQTILIDLYNCKITPKNIDHKLWSLFTSHITGVVTEGDDMYLNIINPTGDAIVDDVALFCMNYFCAEDMDYMRVYRGREDE